MGLNVHIKKGDQVMVITGKETGKSGRVLSVNSKEHRVLIEKLNLIKRHTKPSQRYKQGGIIERENPIDISNVMVICGSCSKPSRTGIKIIDLGKKLRYCKKCGEIIDKG